MTDKSSTGFGYFIALMVLISFIPIMFVTIGHYRKKLYGSERFEAKLGEEALQCTKERRTEFVRLKMEEMQSSLVGRTSAMLQKSAAKTEAGEKDNIEEHSFRVFQSGLLEGRSYWGLGDSLAKDGVLISRGDCRVKLPLGLAEDWTYAACNTINPLPFLFGDDKHPESMASRLLVYCTAQCFVLIPYILWHDDATVVGYVLAPLVVICEHWLRLTLFCPCLSHVDEFEEEEDEDVNRKMKRWSSKAFTRTARLLGGLLAFPIFAFLLTSLIICAIVLANKQANGVLLAKFLWDGILLPFLIKIILHSLRFLTVMPSTFFSICGFVVIRLNDWTQNKLHDQRLNSLSGLSDAEKQSARAEDRNKHFNEIDIFHASCHCLRCTRVGSEFYNTVDFCQPSLHSRDFKTYVNLVDVYEDAGETEPLSKSPFSDSVHHPTDCKKMDNKCSQELQVVVAKNDSNKEDEML